MMFSGEGPPPAARGSDLGFHLPDFNSHASLWPQDLASGVSRRRGTCSVQAWPPSSRDWRCRAGRLPGVLLPPLADQRLNGGMVPQAGLPSPPGPGPCRDPPHPPTTGPATNSTSLPSSGLGHPDPTRPGLPDVAWRLCSSHAGREAPLGRATWTQWILGGCVDLGKKLDI